MITYREALDPEDPRVDNMVDMLAKEASARAFIPLNLTVSEWMIIMHLVDATTEANFGENLTEYRIGYWTKFELMTKVVRDLTGRVGDVISSFDDFDEMKEALGGSDYGKDWNTREVLMKMEYQNIFWLFATSVEALAAGKAPEDSSEFTQAAWPVIRRLNGQVPPLVSAVALERYGVEL